MYFAVYGIIVWFLVKTVEYYLVSICHINGINTKDKNKITIKSSWLPRDNIGSSVTSDLYQLQLSSNTGKPIFYDSSSQFNIVFL